MKLQYLAFYLLIFLCHATLSIANTILVGPSETHTSVQSAAAVVQPGDTIMVLGGTYQQQEFLTNLQGTAGNWIVLLAQPGQTVIYQGGSEGWHITDGAYLKIVGFIFEQQTANGVNIDDGGTYQTPSHDIIIENCTFRNMAGTGNNDLLKLSGLDNFEIKTCIFLNGASGGSGIDMVGCHHGLIAGCNFENMGSNCIQAKGGTQFITIERNYFKNGGHRSVNLGGSTGLQYFRPIDATFEAADLNVHSNIFIGSTAPIAYVGCVRVVVSNNTIYLPGNWVFRILQETVDPIRFVPCGQNTFANNIVYRDNGLSTDVNIGPNTDPGSFTVSNNLWYNVDNLNWPGPGNLPVSDPNQIVEDPQFSDPANENFSIGSGSPAATSGNSSFAPSLDYAGSTFKDPPSRGAFQAEGSLAVDILSMSGEVINYQAKILWTTTNEIDQDFYEIQRSVDGMYFVPIGKVKANNLIPAQTYSFWDRDPPSGVNYYRIKAWDVDGQVAWQKVISLTVFRTKIWYAQETKLLKISIPASEYLTDNIQIVSVNGRQVFTNNILPQEYEINLARLSPGIYFVLINNRLNPEIHKIVVR